MPEPMNRWHTQGWYEFGVFVIVLSLSDVGLLPKGQTSWKNIALGVDWIPRTSSIHML